MKSEIIREDRESYTVMKALGKPNAENIIEWIKEYYETRLFFRTIWDFRECDVSNVDIHKYEDISLIIKDSSWGTQPHLTAMVLHSEHEKLLASAFEAFAAAVDLPVEFQEFLNIDEAVNWITTQDD